MTTPESPVRDRVEQYDRYKALLPDVQYRILQPLPEAEMKALLDEAASRLRLMEGGQIQLGARYEVSVVADHAFYDLVNDGKTVVQRYLEAAEPATDPDEAALLAALTRSRWAVLRVVAVEPGVGILVTDALDNRTHFVVAPETADGLEADELIAARWITPPDLIMPTSGVMPFSPVMLQQVHQALDERFPYRRRRGLDGLTPVEAADFNAIIGNAALDAMALYLQIADEDLTDLDLSGKHHQDVKPERLPRGQRPKATGKAKKKHKRR
jgi:hypothetical protein